MTLTQAPTGGGRTERAPRGTYPPYVHFTLQKTNRDTQDALQNLARTLHVPVKALSTAGTKDKRGVTVQRVSLRRDAKTVAMMFFFISITCRNIQVDSIETLDQAMNSIKERGFINYYGDSSFRGAKGMPF